MILKHLFMAFHRDRFMKCDCLLAQEYTTTSGMILLGRQLFIPSGYEICILFSFLFSLNKRYDMFVLSSSKFLILGNMNKIIPIFSD